MDDGLEVVAEGALGQRPDHLTLEFIEFEDEIAGGNRRPAERDGRRRDTDRVLDETSRTRACRLRLDLILHPEPVELGQALLVATAQRRRGGRRGDVRGASRQRRKRRQSEPAAHQAAEARASRSSVKLQHDSGSLYLKSHSESQILLNGG